MDKADLARFTDIMQSSPQKSVDTDHSVAEKAKSRGSRSGSGGSGRSAHDPVGHAGIHADARGEARKAERERRKREKEKEMVLQWLMHDLIEKTKKNEGNSDQFIQMFKD